MVLGRQQWLRIYLKTPPKYPVGPINDIFVIESQELGLMDMENNFGFDSDTWDEAKKEAFNKLQEIAKSRESRIYYSKLTEYIKAIVFKPNDDALGVLLGQINEDEKTHGRPMISAVVVRKPSPQYDGELPGPGFFKQAKKFKREGKSNEAIWLNELEKVKEYWKAD